MGLPSFRRSPFWLSLAVLAGCADDPPFQSLSSLCDDLTEDICTVRVNGCCAGTDALACTTNETARCNTQLAALQAEAVYKFDAVEAAHTRETSRRQLDLCGTAPALITFFQGGLPNDAPCERDTQCSGGSCLADRRVCATVTPVPLCSAQ